jgi:hypothetical protein
MRWLLVFSDKSNDGMTMSSDAIKPRVEVFHARGEAIGGMSAFPWALIKLNLD